jgi:hypothetical protein
MAATRNLLIALRLLSIGMLVFLIIELGLIYNSEVFNVWEVLNIIGQLRDLISYGAYIGLYMIFTGLFYAFGGLFSAFPGFDSVYYFNFMSVVFSNMIGNWFYLPVYDAELGKVISVSGAETILEAPTLSDAQSMIGNVARYMSLNLYMVLLQAMVGFMFFFAIRASLTNNAGESIKTIVLLNVILIIPMLFIQLNIVILTFSDSTPLFLQEIMANELLKDTIYQEVSDDFGVFITSEIFLVALFSFLYLELVFQIAYIDKVTAPSIEREARLTNQIKVLKIESEKAIANVKALEEKKREQKRLAINMAQMEEEREEKKRLSLRSFMSEKAAGAFSFVSELIEKKKAEKEEAQMMNAMRDTRRLANYLDKLFKQDPEAFATLTAKTSAPTSTKLLSSTITNIIFRLVLVTLLAWLCVHPYYVYKNIFMAPNAIIESVELQTYEGTLSLLIPFLLIIPLMSQIIKVTKHSKLQEMLKLEEIRRSGLTEEELERLEEERENVAKEEVQLQRDQDAIDDQAKKAGTTPQTP